MARNASSVMAVRAKPTMTKRRARDLWDASSYSAGMSLRLARSPDAPKMTMAHGSAAFTEISGTAAAASAMSLVGVIGRLLSSLRFLRLDGMPAELAPHGGQQLARVGIGIARRQPLD